MDQRIHLTKQNLKTIDTIKIKLKKIINSENKTETKITDILTLIVEDQSKTQDLIKRGFTGIALQNNNLFEQNEKLREEISILNEELHVVTNKLQEKLYQERLVNERRINRKNRKRLPKRDPITKEYYNFLISETYKLNYSKTFRGARLRLALSLLLVTGVRIGELLPLKIYQIKTLFAKHWIAIDRAKRGPSSHKAFLTQEGKRIMQERLSDLEVILLSKDDDSYIFTAECSDKPLDREAFNRLVNQFIRSCSYKLEGNPNLKSHSFRIGFISQLWKDSNDIEFVRQSIGHAKIDTTSKYVENLSDQERKVRIDKLVDYS